MKSPTEQRQLLRLLPSEFAHRIMQSATGWMRPKNNASKWLNVARRTMPASGWMLPVEQCQLVVECRPKNNAICYWVNLTTERCNLLLGEFDHRTLSAALWRSLPLLRTTPAACPLPDQRWTSNSVALVIGRLYRGCFLEQHWLGFGSRLNYPFVGVKWLLN